MSRYESCYTYFSIIGKFEPQEVTSLLGIAPEKFIGEKEINHGEGEIKDWACGFCYDCSLYVEEQVRKTIAPLLDKIDILNKIKQNNEVDYYITVVPEYYTDEYNYNCGLYFPIDIIDFCSATKTEIDVDMYLWDSPKKRKSKRKNKEI